MKQFEKKIFLLAVIILIIPIVVWLIYSVLPPIIFTEITADGMLSYFSSSLSILLSLYSLFIVFNQNEKIIAINIELEEEKRRKEIKPNLYIEVTKDINSKYEITIRNYGQHSAIDIYLYDVFILKEVKGNSFEKIVFSIDDEESGVINIDSLYCDGFTNVFPNHINLIYGDIGDNTISQDFRVTKDNTYYTFNYSYVEY